MRSMRLVSLLPLLGAVCVSVTAATFTIDPAQSSVTLSGSVSSAPLSPQGPGSLTTRLEGTLAVETAGGQITLAGGTIDARTNGVWAPGPFGEAGSAPADFGAQATSPFGAVIGALRDIVMTANSPAITLNGAQFNASSIVFSFPEGSTAALDFDAGVIGRDRRMLAANATNNAATTGSLTGSAGARVLTIDVKATFVFSLFFQDDSPLTVEGRIVAREGGVQTGPRIVDIDVTPTEVKITADGTTAATKVLSSGNLVSWAEKASTAAALDADTRVYTMARGGKFEFYQLQQ